MAFFETVIYIGDLSKKMSFVILLLLLIFIILVGKLIFSFKKVSE